MWRRCKRYPAVSSLAAALLLALLGGFAGVTSQWIRADRQADIAGQQRDDARRNLYHSLVREARAIRLARVSGYRREVWDRLKQALALDTPVKDLDWEKLARLNVTGGNIRNIAMNAAFLAADEGGPVRMSHILQAARSEYVKLERPLTDSEIRGWL